MGGSISAGRSNAELVHNLATQHANSRNCPHVEEPMLGVDRGNYFLPAFIHFAYQDQAWKHNQIHLSAPVIYWEVLDLLQLKPGLSFLNVGSGTGYLSTMAGLVLGSTGVNHGIELYQEVITYAYEKLADFKQNSESMDRYDFCEPVFVQGNCLSLAEEPRQYDRVYCGAACPHDKEAYMKSLIKVGGILVMPFEDYLVQIRRVGENQFTTNRSMQVAFSNLQLPAATDAAVATLPELHPPSLKDLARTRIRQLLRESVEAACPRVTKLRRYVPRAYQGRSYKLEDVSGEDEEEEINSDDDDDLMAREQRVIRDDSDDHDDRYDSDARDENRSGYNDDQMSGSELETHSQECRPEANGENETMRNVGGENSVGNDGDKTMEGDQRMETVGDSNAANEERGIVNNDGGGSDKKDGNQRKKENERMEIAQDSKVRNNEDMLVENDGDPSVAKDESQRMENVGDKNIKSAQNDIEENNDKISQSNFGRDEPAQSKYKSDELTRLFKKYGSEKPSQSKFEGSNKLSQANYGNDKPSQLCCKTEEPSHQNQDTKCSSHEKDELRDSLERVLKVKKDKNGDSISSETRNTTFTCSETDCSNSRTESSSSDKLNDLKGATYDASCSHSENNDPLGKNNDLLCKNNELPCHESVSSSQSCNTDNVQITTNKTCSSKNYYSPCQRNKSNDSSSKNDSRKVSSTNIASSLFLADSSNVFKTENKNLSCSLHDRNNFFKPSDIDAASLHGDASDRMDTCSDNGDISAGACNVGGDINERKQTSVDAQQCSPVAFKREKFDSGVVDDGSSGDSSSGDSALSNDSAVSLPPKSPGRSSGEKIGARAKRGGLKKSDGNDGDDGDAKKSVVDTTKYATGDVTCGCSNKDGVGDTKKDVSDFKDSLGDVRNRVGDNKSVGAKKKNAETVNPFEDAKNRLAGIRKLSALTLNGQTSLKHLFGDGVRTFGASPPTQDEDGKQRRRNRAESSGNQSQASGASASHFYDSFGENQCGEDGDTSDDASQPGGAFQHSDDELPVETASEMVDRSPNRLGATRPVTGGRGESSTSPYPSYRELQDMKRKLRKQDSSTSEANRGESNLRGEERVAENDRYKHHQEVTCERQKNELKNVEMDSGSLGELKDSEREQNPPNLDEEHNERNCICSENSKFNGTDSPDCNERTDGHSPDVNDSESRLSSDSNSESKRKYATDSEASEEASSHDVGSGSRRRHRGNTSNKKFKPVTHGADIDEEMRVRVRDNMLEFADEDFPVASSESGDRLNERSDSENRVSERNESESQPSERNEPDGEQSEDSRTLPDENITFRFRSARFGLVGQLVESEGDNAERMRQRIGFLCNLMETARPNVANRSASQRSGERNESDDRLSESMSRLTERSGSVTRRLGRRRFISSDSEAYSEEEGAGSSEETEQGPSYGRLMREAIQKLPLPLSVKTYLNYDREF